MKRGVTPTHFFTTDLDCTSAVALYITYAQGKRVVFEKTIDDVEIDPTEIRTHLTQEETLLLTEGIKVKMQIRVKFADGSAFITDVMYADVDELLRGGVI